MIGQIISHYKILEKLGEGGMGIVYRAHDMKLDRTVALKFLPPQVSATEQDKTRFTQEARAAAALNHPHICHIYRIDEVDAPPASGRTGEKLMFIEMEHVDGVTLRKKISEDPVPLADALNLATQIGEGLEEAHGKGIVHRDIKSDNVMLNARHQAKVMDFGLAKLKGALKLTRSSSTVGTLAYMAPEQLRGVEADARSDIFSFGVLFYEMLTGHVPFEGAHEAALMYSITNEAPTPLEKYIPEAPAELLHIINRSLEKDPEDRYQTVHDMVIDIRRMKKDSTRVSQTSIPRMQTPSAPQPSTGSVPLTPVPTGAPSGEVRTQIPAPEPARRTSSVTIQIPTGGRSWMMIAAIVVVIGLAVVGYIQFSGSGDSGGRLSIAVADFQNRTNEPELDGLSGMLTTAMEQSKRLSVVTRSHMFDILKQMGKEGVEKIDEATGKEICTRAGIGALVTASIQKLGKLYIIDLKVVDPTKNEYLFTAKEEGEGQESIPAMLDNLSEKTRAGLKEKADEIKGSTAELAAVTTTNMEAYQHYFKGEEFLNKLNMEKAEEEFRKAVTLDSLFGLAWYRLAYTLNWSGVRSGRDNDAIPRALALIDRIPDKEKYFLRALAAGQAFHYTESIKILKDMETHYPNDKEMMYNLGDWSYHESDLATALEYLNRTIAIDPVHERALQHLVWTYRETGQYEKMLAAARRYQEVAQSVESINLLSEAYQWLGNYDEAEKELTSLREAHPGKPNITRELADFLFLKGDLGGAEAELEKLVASGDSVARTMGIGGLSTFFSATGQYKKAAHLIENRIDELRSARDSAGAASMLIGRAFLEREMTGSADRVDEFIRRSAQYRVPYSNFDYWASRTMIEIRTHPERDYDPVFKQGALAPFFDVMQLCAQGSCVDGAAAIHSLPKTIPPEAKFNLSRLLAECYYHKGLYSDALASVHKALAQKFVHTRSQYPPTLALLGKIQDEMGNRSDALATYGKFLSIWKEADEGIPLLVDVKKRVAKLGGISAR